MNRAARLSFVALGLAAVVYGTASLTGGWMGTPPWWNAVALPRYPLPVLHLCVLHGLDDNR